MGGPSACNKSKQIYMADGRHLEKMKNRDISVTV